MKSKLLLLCLSLLLVAIATTVVLHKPITQTSPSPTPPAETTSPSATPTTTPAAPVARYADPIAEFKSRITKKMFGTYITPETSPVQPERFKGYHTGVDVEYGDVTADVPLYAMADGTVRRSGWTSGYGGLVVIEHTENNTSFYSLYGHLRPSSLPKDGTLLKKGQQFAVLGTAYTTETDGERRHLHFAIITSSKIDVRGYVQSKSELAPTWKDPLTFY